MDEEELTASEILCRLLGVGLFEADKMLEDVSQQQRDEIRELYSSNEINSILEIVSNGG